MKGREKKEFHGPLIYIKDDPESFLHPFSSLSVARPQRRAIAGEDFSCVTILLLDGEASTRLVGVVAGLSVRTMLRERGRESKIGSEGRTTEKVSPEYR